MFLYICGRNKRRNALLDMDSTYDKAINMIIKLENPDYQQAAMQSVAEVYALDCIASSANETGLVTLRTCAQGLMNSCPFLKATNCLLKHPADSQIGNKTRYKLCFML